jgi:hypothetical protein
MQKDFKKIAFEFFNSQQFDKNNDYYCETRDVFQARLDKMMNLLLKNSATDEGSIYMVSAITGEIGNNSFDHNIGSWVGEKGIFFANELNDGKLTIVLADAGQGVKNTLKKVKPGIKDDMEALEVAFNERISGRAPESRGNGLKFVKANIRNKGMHLEFFSGKAKAELNSDEKIALTNEHYQGCLAIISLKI